ncbi:MAG TPA: phosphohistidine phosphatase SixA [Pyrinomonadaceae bacterium]|nr:phosphohistidine phosphatase SixA [Pyrinomonadaceae bacterium]
MKLYFLRHGEADWPNWTKPDDERPLTKHGKDEMKKVAAFLEKLKVSLDQIITSPLPRAKQTAEIVANRLDLKLREDDKLAPGFHTALLKQLFKKYPGENIMIVGHEPSFTDTIGELTGATLKLSKAGLALLDVDPADMRGRLLWLWPPKIVKVC